MHPNGYIGRKMRLPELKTAPAIVIAAFGSTTRAKAALDLFKQQLADRFPDPSIYWAYTSEIVRKKLGLPSLHETLARVEADGYRKAVVQPLHVFPGTEYQHLAETCAYFPGLRVFVGETLLHRWDFVSETLVALEPELLTPTQGVNLLALHGTPLAADPVNIVYLGLERLVRDRYPNVWAAAIEGVPAWEAVIARMAREKLASTYGRLRIVPMMYFAGLHAEEDLMGPDESWRTALEALGFEVECPMVDHEGERRYKGLAYYPAVTAGFMTRLERALGLANCY